MFKQRNCVRKEELQMDIYTYFFFSYGLTAIIALFTVGIILLVNKFLNRLQEAGK